jgi:hypothetical protein
MTEAKMSVKSKLSITLERPFLTGLALATGAGLGVVIFQLLTLLLPAILGMFQ